MSCGRNFITSKLPEILTFGLKDAFDSHNPGTLLDLENGGIFERVVVEFALRVAWSWPRSPK